jgi:hypothetical protein
MKDAPSNNASRAEHDKKGCLEGRHQSPAFRLTLYIGSALHFDQPRQQGGGR